MPTTYTGFLHSPKRIDGLFVSRPLNGWSEGSVISRKRERARRKRRSVFEFHREERKSSVFSSPIVDAEVLASSVGAKGKSAVSSEGKKKRKKTRRRETKKADGVERALGFLSGDQLKSVLDSMGISVEGDEEEARKLLREALSFSSAEEPNCETDLHSPPSRKEAKFQRYHTDPNAALREESLESEDVSEELIVDVSEAPRPLGATRKVNGGGQKKEKIMSPPRARFCSSCGFEIGVFEKGQVRFCPGCGSRVGAIRDGGGRIASGTGGEGGRVEAEESEEIVEEGWEDVEEAEWKKRHRRGKPKEVLTLAEFVQETFLPLRSGFSCGN
uniref:Uncharacterized protein n=1 Tax=Chromera velia CCMP2878 TaxID=1169474 RepID=A0A0G4HEA7_9ALVE|eukprot:Cvel_6537.t1-p1 / transcript=Cvel_6537.t1 / gene=Cvel_6537 / organism=Chromera_velia_CCMP2878 / gene_product=hypothetical protein / transcript_product=hypothetical protein / location=Cvel_scaffold321:99977-100963(+) / protein_length=329 / sequence_SO=supercontig / SO=protein_coding / is_pseudo=false